MSIYIMISLFSLGFILMTPKLGAGASMVYSSYNLYIPNNVKGKFSLQIILTYMSVLIKFIFIHCRIQAAFGLKHCTTVLLSLEYFYTPLEIFLFFYLISVSSPSHLAPPQMSVNVLKVKPPLKLASSHPLPNSTSWQTLCWKPESRNCFRLLYIF